MFYITKPQSPIYHQITIEELLSGKANSVLIRDNFTNTRTLYTSSYDRKTFGEDRIEYLITKLESYSEKHANLYAVSDRRTLYHSFKIPKKSGGLRSIDEPLEELKLALYELKSIFETDFGALYHTSAYAYIKNRSIIDALKKHQQNDSYWYLKTDLTDFFGSTTKEFVMSMLSQIFPFAQVCKSERGRQALSKAIDLAFLDGGLPQGTPLSPMLTNIIMIPIDYKLQNALHSFNKNSFIYTRYADDMLISCHYSFRFTEVVGLINETLKECGAPYQIKDKKTRYGSRNGSNWNLGLMINKDNNITIGHEKKKVFRAMLVNYSRDHLANIKWELEDVQHIQGLMSYYKMIEPDYIKALIEKINLKQGVDIDSLIKADLSA